MNTWLKANTSTRRRQPQNKQILNDDEYEGESDGEGEGEADLQVNKIREQDYER